MGHDEHEEPKKASSCAAAPHQASTGKPAGLSPEQLLAGALLAFKQEADSAAARSPNAPPQGSAQQEQEQLLQASSLPDLSRDRAPEGPPSHEGPSPTASEPGPQQERQSSAIVRPTPQRIGLGEVNTGSLPLSPSTSLRPMGSLKNLGCGSPITPSNSLRGGSLGIPTQAEQAVAGQPEAAGAHTAVSPSWQPQGSAWKRYVAQAAEAAGAFKGMPALFGAASPGQPGQAPPPTPLSSAQPTGQAAGQTAGQQAAEEAAGTATATSAPAAPAQQHLPVQLSLDRLQAERRSSLQRVEEGGATGRDPMETLQAAASALFKQLIKTDPGQQSDDAQAAEQVDAPPEAFGSRLPSMASNYQEAAASFLQAARTNSGQSPALSPAQTQQTQQAQHMQHMQQAARQSFPYLQLLQSMDSRQLQSLSTVSASPPPSAEQQTESEKAPSTTERLQKGWAEAAAALLGPVAPRQQLTSAFSDALASRAGQLSPLALPQETNQPAAQAPVQKAAQAEAAAMPKEDWATACFSSLKDTTSHYSLPVSSWQLPTSGEGQNRSMSLPAPTGDPNFLKMPGNLLAGMTNMGSLVMPGTPSLPNMPSRASLSPPMSPQESMSPLGRQLEMCLARQVQVQNAKRHGPLQVLMSDEQVAAATAAAVGGNPQRFGAIPWPHASQQSLDSQVSRMQLAQAALAKSEMFKVPGNLASFLKQASLDTAMALLQQQEATPPTPVARQLAGQGGGAIWPFGAAGMQQHAPAMSPGGLSPDPRMSAHNLQSSPLRGMAGLQSAMHGEPHRLHASQQVFQDMGASAINPQLHEAVLADSLYRSVTERLQSGAGPASFNQGGGLQYGAPEDATFYRMDSGAAHGGAPNYSGMPGMMGGGHHGQAADPHQHMMELLGLLRAGLVTPQDQMSGGGKRKRRSNSPGQWRKRRGDEPSEGRQDALPPPKRSANNKCEECGTTETPTWRRWGPTLLCNACGLRRKKNPKLQPPPPKEAQHAEPAAQQSWDPSMQHSGEDARSGDHSQLSHPMSASVPQ